LTQHARNLFVTVPGTPIAVTSWRRDVTTIVVALCMVRLASMVFEVLTA